MRLWSLHPSLLDTKGLGACWREALLAQAVLSGKTKGYRHHPQLKRFRGAPGAIRAYLLGVHAEARNRGFKYNKALIQGDAASAKKLKVTRTQAVYERVHLLKKLEKRSPDWYRKVKDRTISLHPLFQLVETESNTHAGGEDMNPEMVEDALKDAVYMLRAMAMENGGKLSSVRVDGAASPWEVYFGGLCALVWEYDAMVHPSPPVPFSQYNLEVVDER